MIDRVIGILKIKKPFEIYGFFLLANVIAFGFYSSESAATTCKGKATSVTIDVGNQIIQKDAPLGVALTGEITGNGSAGYTCTGGPSSSGVKTYGADTGLKTPEGIKILSTNIAGLGLGLGATGATTKWIGSTQADWTGSNWVLVWGTNESTSDTSTTVKIILYRTAELSSGTLSGQIGAFIIGNGVPPTSWGTNNEIPINITGSVTVLACSLSSTSINVPLGDVLVSKFTGITTTVGDKSFNLGLSCDKDAKINVSLAGTQNTDTSETSVLALTSAGQTGTASGVGVQLLYGGVPLKINANLLLKASAGGQETLPFTARYYQTKAVVGPGQANSSATLNITYQ
jgi:type 1 fimbria pilin